MKEQLTPIESHKIKMKILTIALGSTSIILACVVIFIISKNV